MADPVHLQPRVAEIAMRAMAEPFDCIVVKGEPGAGKSALLDTIASAYPGRYVRLRIHWGSLEDQLPYLSSAMAQLQSMLGTQGDRLDPERLAELTATRTGEVLLDRLAPTLEHLFAEFDELREPVWVLIDDVDALHHDMLQVLRHLIARTAHWAGGFICTVTWPLPELEPYWHLELDPLTLEGLIAWIDSCTGVRPPVRVARQLHDWSCGHPSVLGELIASTELEALQGGRLLVPGPPGPVVRSRAEQALAGAGEDIQQLLLRLAVVGGVDLATLTVLAEDAGTHAEVLLARGHVRLREGRFSVGDSLLGHVLATSGAEFKTRDIFSYVVRLAGDVLSPEDYLLFTALSWQRDVGFVPRLEEAALSAAARGDAERALRFSAAMGRHLDRSTGPRHVVVSSLVAAYDGRLQDAIEIAGGELRRLPPSSDRLTILIIYQIALFLSAGDFDPNVTMRELRAHLDSEPRTLLRVAQRTILMCLEVGRVDDSREILDFVKDRYPAESNTNEVWVYLHARLRPDATAKSVVSAPAHLTLGARRSEPRKEALQDDLGQSFLLHGISTRLIPSAATADFSPALKDPNSSLQEGSAQLLKAESEVRRGEFTAAEARLRQLDDLHAIEAFMPHRRLAAELRIATVRDEPLTPHVARALHAVQSRHSNLLDAMLWMTHGAWLLGQGLVGKADRLISQAASTTAGEDCAVAILGDPDLELVLPALYLGVCRHQHRLEEAVQYARDVVLVRAGQSPYAAVAGQFARAVLAFAGANRPLALPEAAELPLWARGVIAGMWAPATPQGTGAAAAATNGTPTNGGYPPQFTPREAEVAELLKSGSRNKEISGALYLSVRTVEASITSMFRKTGVSSRTALTAFLHGFKADHQPCSRLLN